MDRSDLIKALTISREDIGSMSLEERRAMEMNRNMLHSPVEFLSDYSFFCDVCQEASPWLNPYHIIKELSPEVVSTKGITHISSLRNLKIEPEYTSRLNNIDGKNVCDHCYDAHMDEIGDSVEKVA